MSKLATRSVHSPIQPRKDGLRILAARFRGRGLSRDRYDVWMPSLGPSEKLLRAFLAHELAWKEFKKRYLAELLSSSELDAGNRSIKNHGQKFTLRLLKHLAEREPVTLLCHCAEEEPHCHRHLLRELIESARI